MGFLLVIFSLKVVILRSAIAEIKLVDAIKCLWPRMHPVS